MPPCHCQPLPPLISRHVAVIGAGAAGLIAARELRREGHKVVVFERENQVGGTWVYTPQVERDPLGLDPTRPIIHSSLYKSLRTNLPREVMGFTDYPFVPRDGEGRDPRRFPGHREVLLYLEDFAQEFEVDKMVRFETEVLKVWYLEEGSSDDGKKNWRVRSKRKASNSVDEEVYDAVVVCNGHYTEPRLAEVPGISSWPGKQMHSHNYRTPESFRDQVVILIGSAASAVDISREVAEVAKEVHISSRGVAGETYEKQHGYDNLWLHSMIESAHEDGSMVFHNGRVVYADIILHCTGYKYQFPFLETNGIVTVDDNRVGPLYKHVFPPDLAPFLSFVGLPFKVIPFPLSELQSKWIAGVLSGQIVLPSPDEMMEDVKAFYMALEASNRPRHHTHNLGNSQFDYDNWLASQSMSPAIEEWRKLMYVSSSKSRNLMPESYRDEWKDEELVSEAYKYFATLERYNGCISLCGN